MKALSTNILANHPSYAKIMTAYNTILKEKGRVNNKNFFETVILPEIPNYNLPSWYQFLRRFKTEVGIVPIDTSPHAPTNDVQTAEEDVQKTLLSNAEATSKGLQLLLNIGAQAAKEIMENPQEISAIKRAELLTKAMKSQDSRVKAIGGLRADNREQERFDRMMDSAAYG